MSVEPWTLDSLVEAYRQHQRRTRGLRERTLDGYERLVRMFVRTALGEDPIDPSRLCTGDVVGFVVAMQARFSPCSMKAVRTALRSFFRFLRFEGVSDGQLELAIPRVAHWRLSTLPRYLSDAQLALLLASLDASTPWGRRDRAIVCVWRLWGCGLARSRTYVLRTSIGVAAVSACESARPVRARWFRCRAMPGGRSSPTCVRSDRRPRSGACSCSITVLVAAGRCLATRSPRSWSVRLIAPGFNRRWPAGTFCVTRSRAGWFAVGRA
jgi:site-specific recombinase XerD